jgi:hypothetical protein
MINYVEELPNLKDLLKQREFINDATEPKRAKIDLDNSGQTVRGESISFSSIFNEVYLRKSTKKNLSLLHMLIISYSL